MIIVTRCVSVCNGVFFKLVVNEGIMKCFVCGMCVCVMVKIIVLVSDHQLFHWDEG